MKNNKLDYCLVFNPNQLRKDTCEKLLNEEEIKQTYLYKDNYFHVRLNEFGDKPNEISGFENKLSFLITILINNSSKELMSNRDILEYSNDLKNQKYIWNKSLNLFYASEDYRELMLYLIEYYPNCKGIKILPRYSKIKKFKSCFDYLGICHNLNSLIVASNLQLSPMVFLFSNYFGQRDNWFIDFLLDDRYSIKICKNNVLDYSKFTNKYFNKHNSKYKEINLW